MKTTPRITTHLFRLVLALCMMLPMVAAAPQPDPISTRWALDFNPGELRIALIDTPDVGLKRYYFFTYRVTNYWDTDLLFAPDAMLRADDGLLHRAGRGVPAVVTNEILRRLDSPLIQDQVAIVGQLLQGPENARDGVLIWPASDLNTDEVTVFFAGLSGETRTYLVGKGDKQKRFVLRKTLMLRYDTPGEFGDRDNQLLPRTEARWIMR